MENHAITTNDLRPRSVMQQCCDCAVIHIILLSHDVPQQMHDVIMLCDVM